MTATALAGMASRNASHPLPPRPPLTSHQSNSVPSTPHQHAREFGSRSRSPSPHTGLGLGSHSPRSVTSEANGPMTTLPKGRPTCKYETSAAFSRRRMQYDIGDAPLDKPKDDPKKTLDPHEEKKLSGDMRELYDRLVPSEESDKRRILFVEKLEKILHKQWSDTEFKVHIFGSSGNLLCTSESDVDICIQTPMKKLETMHMLAEVLANNGMERVICIAAAKVPIVKIWDPELKLAADMNVNNTLALENTRMIKTYVQIDERVRPLAMTVKHWTKQRILNDAGIGGTLSSYAWICMILNFLQTREPPILPALHQMPHKEYKAQDGTESGFNEDIDNLRGYGSANRETIGELLFHFFRRYAYEMEYESSVISVRHGKLLTRREKGWDHTSKEGQWRLCIEEPFNTSRNLGNSVDSTAFRGIHLELRQAYDHIAQGTHLNKAIEAYEYPPEEKVIFKKPVAGPRPILSAAIPPTPPANRAPRGGGSMRGGGRHNGARQGSGYRRSSSGASYGRHPFPFLGSPPIALNGMDYMNAGTPEAMARLHESLLHQSQVNGLQLEQLKARFAIQEQQLRAVEQARNAAAVHAHTVAQGSKQGSQATSSTVSPQKTPYMTGSPSPQLTQIYPDYLYQSFGYDGQYLTQSQSHDGPKTNPSSPSLASATPRRAPQRSGLNGVNQGSGSLRSQSQPARGLPAQFAVPGFPYFPSMLGSSISSHSITGSSQDPSSMSQSSGDGSSSYENGIYRTASMPLQDTTRKEYVGYYMPTTQAPPPAQRTQPPLVFGSLPQIPQYSELAHRRNRPSQDLQLTLNGNRHASRSPSPLGHHRTFSIPVHGSNTGLKSAPLPRMMEQRPDRIEMPSRLFKPSNGPAVVNGSLPIIHTPESRSAASDEDVSTDAGDNPGASFFGKADVFAPSDALGLVGFQGPYTAEHIRPHHTSVVYSPQTSGAQYATATAEEAGTGTVPSAHSPPTDFLPFVEQSVPQSDPRAKVDDHVSPKAAQAPWSAPTTGKPNMAPLDTAKAAQLQNKHSEPKTAPLLSPVYETRTPSPTAIRRPDHYRQTSINGILSPTNGEVAAGTVLSNGRPAEPVPPTPIARADQPNAANNDKNKPATGQWQAPRKKNRKRTKSGPNPRPSPSTGAAEVKPKPEVLPTNETERKGG